MSILLITHDLGVVAETSDRVVVLYQGRVVETGPGARDLRRARASLHASGSIALDPARRPPRRGARLDRRGEMGRPAP